ncbi:MAG: 3-oxoacyl-ACP synthase III family protein [Clostridium sp.]
MPVRIKDSVIVTGSKMIGNDYYINYFKERDKDIEEFLVNTLGRNTRYHCDGITENTLTLASKAVDKLLDKQGILGKDIDLIIFCSQFPEFTMPMQACMIHNHINGKKECFTLDVNANCLGMLRGLDVANRYLNDKNGEMIRALLIGSDYMSVHTKEEGIEPYVSFSDGACVLLLEYTNDEKKGVIGTASRTISENAYYCMFPECGMSGISNYLGSSVKTSWSNPNAEPVINNIKDALDEVLIKHNLKVEDIDWYCGSQFSISVFNAIREKCGISMDKGIYVGDKYGYTGTSSPFFAYTEGVNNGKIKEGDLVFFTTVGTGDSISSMLMRV